MLYAAFFAAAFFLLFGLLLIPFEKKHQVTHRVEVFLGENPTAAGTSTLLPRDPNKQLSFRKRVLMPLWTNAKKKFSKNMAGEQAEKLDRQLAQAGNPFHMKAADFRMVQFVFLLGMPLLSVGYGVLLGFETEKLVMFFLVGIGLGLILPRQFIKGRMAKRKKRALRELPDFVDLLLVSLEAGLGFDSALSKVIGKQEGVLAGEFRRCLEELRLGLSRKEALIGVRDRLEVEEISAFINNIIRAEKLGVGMVQVLRILTVDVRERRRERAEETAQKAPIKILFPLVLFIFPSLFIVILGPVAIQLYHQFMK